MTKTPPITFPKTSDGVGVRYPEDIGRVLNRTEAETAAYEAVAYEQPAPLCLRVDGPHFAHMLAGGESCRELPEDEAIRARRAGARNFREAKQLVIDEDHAEALAIDGWRPPENAAEHDDAFGGDWNDDGDGYYLPQPRFPEGTPEYVAYEAELKTELGKFARGEDPYPYETANPLPVSPAEVRAAGKCGPFMFGDDAGSMTFDADEVRILRAALAELGQRTMREMGIDDAAYDALWRRMLTHHRATRGVRI